MIGFKRWARRAGLAAAALLACTALAGAARAQGVFLAGANVNTDADLYGYVGGVLPLRGGLDDDGPLVRLWAEGFTFEYDTVIAARNTEVDGQGIAAEIEIGYQWLRPGSQVSVYLGPKLRSIDLDPGDPGNDSNQDSLGFKGQLEVTADMADRWNAGFIASYTAVFQDYFFRVRPGYRYNDRLTIGPEVVLLGGDKYDKFQAGLFASGYPVGAGALGFKLGLEHDNRADQFDGYLGVEFAHKF